MLHVYVLLENYLIQKDSVKILKHEQLVNFHFTETWAGNYWGFVFCLVQVVLDTFSEIELDVPYVANYDCK
jgi:hypothetical protein